MGKLLTLFGLTLALPVKILASLVELASWLDVLTEASEVGKSAVRSELEQAQSALDARKSALADQQAQLAEARKARSAASVNKRVSDIKSDFE